MELDHAFFLNCIINGFQILAKILPERFSLSELRKTSGKFYRQRQLSRGDSDCKVECEALKNKGRGGAASRAFQSS
jgi:hypothetical protein